jgi:hypothetical protein
LVVDLKAKIGIYVKLLLSSVKITRLLNVFSKNMCGYRAEYHYTDGTEGIMMAAIKEESSPITALHYKVMKL